MSQAQLDARYHEFRACLQAAAPGVLAAFSPPLLLKLPVGWQEAEHRVLWIGQETAGWSWEGERLRAGGMGWDYPDLLSLGDFAGYEDSVDALTYGYEEFDFAVGHPARRGLFWRYFHWTFDVMRTNGSASMLWTNVVRSSASTGRGYWPWAVPEPTRSAFLSLQRGLLAAEIEILRPSLVIFMSGPDYEVFVRQEFAGCQVDALAPFPVRQAARYVHPALPPATFRSYHPGYLNRGNLGFRPIQAMIDVYLDERSR